MRRPIAGLSLAIVLLVALASSGAAQQPAADSARPARPLLCWRGRPLERCRGWLVTEAGIRAGGDISGIVNAGPMINATRNTAWGMTLGAAIGADDNASLPLLVRHRYWLDRRRAVDAGIGAVLVRWKDVEDGSPEPVHWDGITGLVAYSWNDLAIATLEFDTGNATPVMVGLRTGHYVTGVLAGVAFVVLLLWDLESP